MDMVEETRETSCSKQVHGGEEKKENGEAEPLHECGAASPLVKQRAYHRALLLLRAALFFLFLAYRLQSFMACGSFLHERKLEVVAMACEMCFCISLLMSFSCKWFMVERVAYPDRLLSRWEQLPRVDVFVTTADPIKEPPLITINTVLSVLALHYPTHKMACYVSDDGGSLLTLWALKEATSFAKSWVPFCHTYSSYVYPRAPGLYFAHKSSARKAKLYGFYSEWHAIKEEFCALENQIQSVSEAYCNSKKDTLTFLLNKLLETTTIDGHKATYSSWALNYDPCNHSSHCEVLLDKPLCNTQMDLPYLVYMSREKRPKKNHHFKAGAMNALLRISGVMTNAPYILNLDCDMYVNEAKALLQAMCFFMETRKFKDHKKIGFVQFPQCFQGSIEDDTYGSQKTLVEMFMKGMDAAQGPPYCGTGCVHKRKSLYGGSSLSTSSNLLIDGPKLKMRFGDSQILVLNAQSILTSQAEDHSPTQDALLEESIVVTKCTYEEKTKWGEEVGLIYGTLIEDLTTGVKIHSRGWRSLSCVPYPPAFIGALPSNTEDILIMRKRWCIGTLQFLFSPLLFLFIDTSNGLNLIQRIIYIYFYTSLLQPVPMLIYALLPSLSILTKSPIYPQVLDLGVLIPTALLMCYYISNFYEGAMVGVGWKQGWNTEIMATILALSSDILGFLEVIKSKVMKSEQFVFAITPKEQRHVRGTNYHDGATQREVQQGFNVNSKLPMFVPPTVLVLLNITTLVVVAIQTIKNLNMQESYLNWPLSTEVACSMWILFLLQPFSKGILLWALGQSCPLALSSTTILHSSFIVMALLSLVFITTSTLYRPF